MTRTSISVLVGQVVEDDLELSLAELCRACGAEGAIVEQLVAHGVVEPLHPGAPQGWVFAGASLTRVRTAVRLMHDLDVNPAGAALAVDLLDEIERLQHELQAFGGPRG